MSYSQQKQKLLYNDKKSTHKLLTIMKPKIINSRVLNIEQCTEGVLMDFDVQWLALKKTVGNKIAQRQHNSAVH